MQFFLPQHFSAFVQPKPTIDNPTVVAERVQVRNALLRLDALLWPTISRLGWDLHRHRQKHHYVSSDHFIFLDDGTPIVQYIDAMWLHYGKSAAQLDFFKTIGGFDYSRIDSQDYYNAFYLHTRIQFYLNADVFRAWLLIATDKNYYDRSEFLRRIYREASYRHSVYRAVVPLLGRGFCYEVDSDKLQLVSNLTENQLVSFIKKDHGGAYSGIVKEYLPNDPNLQTGRIGPEMVENLKLLYPVYDLIAWRP